MNSITSEDLRWNLTEVGRAAAAGSRWLVTFHGKPRFAIVPVSDLELLQAEHKQSRPKAKKKLAKRR